MRSSTDERAVSDVVGTMILLAVTAILISVAVAQVNAVSTVEGDPPVRIDLRATAVPSGASVGTVALTHAGGDAFDRGELRLVVDADGTLLSRSAFPGNGTWQVGDSASLALDAPLTGGERLSIALVSAHRSKVIATTTVEVPRFNASSPPTGAFTLSIIEPAGVVESIPGSVFRVVAQVDHWQGRKAILVVVADLTALGGSPTTFLYDDGTHGDVTPGDRRFTAFIVVPASAPPAVANHRAAVHAVAIDGTRTAGVDLLVHVNPAPGTTPPGPPRLDATSPFAPLSGPPNTKVTVRGTNLSYVNSVSLVGSSGDAYGATWWLGSDSELYIVAPLGAPFERDYHVSVTSPTGSATSVPTFRLTSPPGTVISPPAIGAFSPSSAGPGAEVNVTGTNLTYTTGVILSGNGRTYNAVFWTQGSNGTELHFLVPAGTPAGVYNITVANPSGVAVASSPFTVTSASPLVFANFSPRTGIPYTTFSVTGSGLSNVVVVNVGGVGVTFWVVNDSEIRFLTHEGVPVGNATVKLFNRTGSAQQCCLVALAMPSLPEVSTYPSRLFGMVGHNTTKYVGAGSGDRITSYVKFRLTNDSFTVGLDVYTLQVITLVYQPFKPGETGRVTMTPVCQPLPGPNGRVGLWLAGVDQNIPNYVLDEDSFRYFFEMKWTNGRTGSNYRESVFYVDSSQSIQYFDLKPRDTNKVVLDDNEWPSEFTTCNS